MHSVVVSGNNPVSLLQTTPCHLPYRRREEAEVEVGVVPSPFSVNSITSPSNPFVKHCVKLRQSSSYRHTHGSALVVGTTPIREITRFEDLIEDKHNLFHCLLLLDGAEAPKGLRESSIHIIRVSSRVMRKISGLQSTDSIEAAALLKIHNKYYGVDGIHGQEDFRNWFPSPHRILVLDGIQDPGNLGTLLRSAVAFKWNGVFLLPGCCDPFNEKALRASRGASFQLPIVSGSWDQLETLRSNYQIKMLAGHPESKVGAKGSIPISELSSSLVDTHVCLVLGNEGQGLSEQSEQVCEFISIPMAGGYESLNVSVAGGIFLYMLQPKHHKPI